jgi:hypothetical protein
MSEGGVPGGVGWGYGVTDAGFVVTIRERRNFACNERPYVPVIVPGYYYRVIDLDERRPLFNCRQKLALWFWVVLATS